MTSQIFQDGGCGGSILFLASYLLMPLYSKGQNLQQTKFRRHISIHSWDITTSVLEKETSEHTNSTSGFHLSYHTIRMLFCIMVLNFIQIRPSAVEIWRHIHFSRRRQRPLNNTSSLFVAVTTFRRTTKSISKPNFVDISQLTEEI